LIAISKYYTLIESDFGVAAALFNHRTHHIFFKYGYDFSNTPLNEVNYNSASELGIDEFYDKLVNLQVAKYFTRVTLKTPLIIYS